VSDPGLVGRVVLVTGAGRGLGRQHALSLAARGALLVVNDNGASLAGEDEGDPGVAAAVADEIRRAGGQAVESVEDVGTHEGARAAVDAALGHFGRLDGVVANAGVLRDRTFAKMSFEELDEVLRVHLAGAAYCVGAAWASLGESGSGRVVLTSSASGLYGQFGQANYAAAKMGVVGLMNVLTQEGRRSGVHVNVIAPVATTRMTRPLLPEQVHAGLDPAHVSDLVAYLVSAGCRHTGQVLEVGAGLVARVRVVETSARDMPRDGDPEAVAQLLDELDGLDDATGYEDSGSALARILERAAGRPVTPATG
jgi:NAD(P)-dependent dehydrogenase (short-subunit alcohol dehydrogenase family)